MCREKVNYKTKPIIDALTGKGASAAGFAGFC